MEASSFEVKNTFPVPIMESQYKNTETVKTDEKTKDTCGFLFSSAFAELKRRSQIEKFTAIGLNENDAEDIRLYLAENKKRLVKNALGKADPIVIKKEQSGLPRTIQVNPDGHIYILLKTKNKPLIGKGMNKKVKFAYDYTLSQYIASYTIPKESNENLIKNLNILSKAQLQSKLNGLVKILSCSPMPSNKGDFEKMLILMEYYSKRDLTDPLLKFNFTELELKKIFLNIFEGLISLHELGFVHFDIHPKNIFIHENLSGGIGDFDLIKKISSDKQKIGNINYIYSPPEILNRTRSR